MTKSITGLAREAGFADWDGTDDVEFLSLLERFAALHRAAIAAAEAHIGGQT